MISLSFSFASIHNDILALILVSGHTRFGAEALSIISSPISGKWSFAVEIDPELSVESTVQFILMEKSSIYTQLIATLSGDDIFNTIEETNWSERYDLLCFFPIKQQTIQRHYSNSGFVVRRISFGMAVADAG